MILTAPWSTPPASYRDLVDLYERQFKEAIVRGDYVPYVWPYRSFAGVLVILYFLIPPTYSRLVYYTRYPLFAFNVYWAIKAIKECRSAAVSTGYGIGLIDAWGLLWLASLIIFNDARNDFKRIEWIDREERSGPIIVKHGDAKSTAVANGNSSGRELRIRQPNGSLSKESSKPTASTTPPETGYAYRTLPTALHARLSWTYDLLTGFRGVGFNHLIPGMPSPPPHVLASLPHPPKPTQAPPYNPSNKALFRGTIFNLIVGYLALDILKAIMMADPYFWGNLTAAPPSYLPTMITTSPAATKLYRLLLSFAGIYTALASIFALSPLQLLILPKWVLGPRVEAWHYPPMYGNPRALWDRGLIGFWSQWWHQTFRFGFQAPTVWLCKNLGLNEKGQTAKLLGLVIAFGCSGCLHAAGSYTMWPETKPLSPATFFWLQPLGIIGQQALTFGLKRTGIAGRVPRWMGGLTRVVGMVTWFWWTANFFTDDVARGGIWLFEPIPISFVRGARREGWIWWSTGVVGWHAGDRWWESGIAF